MGLRKHEGQGCILADDMYVISLHFRRISLTREFYSGGWGKRCRFLFALK
jgi:hypothetical protein